MPSEHLIAPEPDEEFENSVNVYNHLQNYAFSQGFAIMIGSGGQNKLKTYECIQHKKHTQNN